MTWLAGFCEPERQGSAMVTVQGQDETLAKAPRSWKRSIELRC
jgi:hypothetical protein